MQKIQKKFTRSTHEVSTIITEVYSSTTELLKVTHDRPLKGRWDTINGYNHDPTWTGAKDFAEAEGMLVNGWSKNVDRVNAVVKNAKRAADGKKISFVNGVVGFAPVVPLALQGVPNCMLTTHVKVLKNKVLDIYFDGGYLGHYGVEMMLKAGEKMLAQIIALEAQGYRVRLSFIHYQGTTYSQIGMAVRIKNEAQPLDVKRVMFPMFHPAMFRLIHGAWSDRVPECEGYLDGCTIVNHFSDAECAQIIREQMGETAIYVSGQRMCERGLNDGKAEAYIKECLQGIYA